MCLAMPAEVISVNGEIARVEMGGTALDISLAFLEGIRPGDYVVIHVGYALAKIDPEEASEQIALMRTGAQGDTVS